LDVDGALKVDSEFTRIAEERKNLLVDVSNVPFIASLGIRTLITGAKVTANNGGKLVLLNPQSNVEKVLRTSHIDTVLPIISDATDLEAVFGV
jgi:anti-anti-sigma factor